MKKNKKLKDNISLVKNKDSNKKNTSVLQTTQNSFKNKLKMTNSFIINNISEKANIISPLKKHKQTVPLDKLNKIPIKDTRSFVETQTNYNSIFQDKKETNHSRKIMSSQFANKQSKISIENKLPVTEYLSAKYNNNFDLNNFKPTKDIDQKEKHEMNFNSENQNNKDVVNSCLTNSLLILEKIQKDFELSAKNNTKRIDENRDLLEPKHYHNNSNNHDIKSKSSSFANQTSNNDPIKLYNITKLTPFDLNKLGLVFNSFDSNYKILEVINVSEEEKEFLLEQLKQNSDKRTENYKNLFNVITITLESIQESVKEMNIAAQRALEIEKEKISLDFKRYSFVNTEVRKIKVDYGFIENIDEEKEIAKENLNISSNSINEESCNFSELNMLENAIVVPPKIENRINILKNQENTIISLGTPSNVRIGQKFLNNTIKEENLDGTSLDDNTVIEYDFLFTEDIKDKNEFFNQAKDDVFYVKRDTIKSSLKKSLVQTNYSNENTNFTTINNNNNLKQDTINAGISSPRKDNNCIIF